MGRDAAAMETEALVLVSSPGTVTREMKMVVLDTRAGSDPGYLGLSLP